MANNTFELVGRLAVGKKTEKFDPFSQKVSEKGWKTTILKFNAIAGDNRHFLEVKAGHWDDGHGEIYSFTKGSTDAQGNKVKGESIKIPFKDRFKQENIDKVAEFKKYVVDLEEYGLRYKIKNAFEKLDSEDLTQEDIDGLKVDTYINKNDVSSKIKTLEDKLKSSKDNNEKAKIEKAIEGLKSQLRISELKLSLDIKTKKDILGIMLDVSNKKRKEFLHEQDYAEYLHKLITKGNINDKNFVIKGEKTYSEYQGKTFEHMIPNRIYLAETNSKNESEGQFIVFFNKSSLDENSYAEKKKYYINGYLRVYDKDRGELPCPIQLVIDCTKDDENEKNKKINNLLKKQFVIEDDSWKELGVKCKLLNGSQKIEITEDMLTDFQKEMLELDPDFINEIRKDLAGKELYGEKIQENIIINVARGYSKGRKDTVYIDEDFIVKSVEIKENNSVNLDDETDIFDDDDIVID